MRESESPFQSYKSKRILSFAYLNCSSVSGPKAIEKRHYLRFAILRYGGKLWNVLEIVLEKCEVLTRFCCLSVNLPTVEI